MPKQRGDRAYIGRKPGYTREQFDKFDLLRQEAASIAQIARATGLTRQTVYRIKGDPGVLRVRWWLGTYNRSARNRGQHLGDDNPV